jgi:hypothetical protein
MFGRGSGFLRAILASQNKMQDREGESADPVARQPQDENRQSMGDRATIARLGGYLPKRVYCFPLTIKGFKYRDQLGHLQQISNTLRQVS